MSEQFELKLEMPQKQTPEAVPVKVGENVDPNSYIRALTSVTELTSMISSLTNQIAIHSASSYEERRECEERLRVAEERLEELKAMNK